MVVLTALRKGSVDNHSNNKADLSEDLKQKVSFLTKGAIHPTSDFILDTTSTEIVADNINNNNILRDYPEFDVGPFDGIEKHLVVQFDDAVLRSSPFLTDGSLRSLSMNQWQSVLDKAQCQILSFKELKGPDERRGKSSSCTAYLLSESSLFVFDNRVILKTCG